MAEYLGSVYPSYFDLPQNSYQPPLNHYMIRTIDYPFRLKLSH